MVWQDESNVMAGGEVPPDVHGHLTVDDTLFASVLHSAGLDGLDMNLVWLEPEDGQEEGSDTR